MQNTTKDIAYRLVELMRNQQFVLAYEQLYSSDAISIDPLKPDLSPIKGLSKLIELEKAFLSKVTIHAVDVSEPICSGIYFAIRLFMNLTVDSTNTLFEELCVYEVRNNNIVSQQFFVTR